MSDKNKTVKTVSYIMIITLFGKVLALIRDMLLARFYDSGINTSAFLTASRIPRVLFDAIFASAITSSFIPIFNKVLKKDGQDKAYEFSDVFIISMCPCNITVGDFSYPAVPGFLIMTLSASS